MAEKKRDKPQSEYPDFVPRYIAEASQIGISIAVH
jgi:hypothetical protein